jgi:hypothetical protein
MKALICNTLCFGKTEINRFQSISGGVFLTQKVIYNHSIMYIICDIDKSKSLIKFILDSNLFYLFQ